jgi:hypothetical protein
VTSAKGYKWQRTEGLRQSCTRERLFVNKVGDVELTIARLFNIIGAMTMNYPHRYRDLLPFSRGRLKLSFGRRRSTWG